MADTGDLTLEPAANHARALSLVDLLRRGELVFFCGAALSTASPSNLPLAGEIKEKALSAIVARLRMEKGAEAELITEDRLARVRNLPLEVMFQFVYNSVGPTAVDAFQPLNTDRDDPPFNHNHQFLALAAGDLTPVVLTTNWDHLLEDALAANGRIPDTYIEDAQIPSSGDLESLSPRNVVPIVKLHGTIERKASVIVTMEQAGDRLSSPKASALVRLLKDYHVCFVGYGLGDYDIFSTLRGVDPSDVKGLYVLFRPPSVGESEAAFRTRNARALGIMRQKGGAPIVLDINGLFDALCAELFQSEHAAHSGRTPSRPYQPDVAAHIGEWAARISPLQAHVVVGSLFYHVGDGLASEAVYKSAISADLALDGTQRIQLHLGHGYACARTGRYGEYLRHSQTAYRLATRDGSRFDVAEALFHCGDALRQLGGINLLRAYVVLARAGWSYKQVPGRVSKHGLGSALLSSSLIARSVLPRATLLRPLRKAILRSLENAYSLLGGPNGNAMRIIAELQAEAGDFQRSVASADEAELLCVWHEDDVGLANTLRAKARILGRTGRPSERAELYLRALRASREAGDTPGIVKALDGLAEVAGQCGRFGRCETLRRLAMDVLKSAGRGSFGVALPTRVAAGLAYCRIRKAIRRLMVYRGPR